VPVAAALPSRVPTEAHGDEERESDECEPYADAGAAAGSAFVAFTSECHFQSAKIAG
jgi:hypothetical protein